jgi:hypothetical protein
MRLKHFITESKDIDIAFIKKLKKECKEYFYESRQFKKNLPLYRGMKKRISTYEIITPRKNRKPLSTDPVVHELLDEEFKKQFGWKPRSEGVFCIGDYPPGMYGERYYIFPIGKLDFLWSPYIKDLTVSLDHSGIFTTDYKLDPEVPLETVNDVVFQLVSTYQDDDFLAALRSVNEIMLKCKKYYALNVKVVESSAEIYEELFRGDLP